MLIHEVGVVPTKVVVGGQGVLVDLLLDVVNQDVATRQGPTIEAFTDFGPDLREGAFPQKTFEFSRLGWAPEP